MTAEIPAEEAKRRLHSAGEIAFLDVREAGEFGEGHPLFAVPCPYSRLEILVPALVPNRRVPVLLLDGGDGVAERAARRLAGLGYREVATVAGGAPGWAAAGFSLFKGVNVPSKALGELAEALWHPTMIDPAGLAEWRRQGRAFQLFDARPPAEFAKMNVPGAACLPNGELAHRFAAAVADPAMPVVVNCAGRTRGIVGAIGLRLTGVPNPVLALENGTQGWALAGETLERGQSAAPFAELGPAALEDSRQRADRFCSEWRIAMITTAELEALLSEEARTTYLVDVRSAAEFAAGHLPGAVHAPSGQLVQATDQWIGVRRARLVLADDTGLRAALAAFWLRQLGFEVFVLAAGAVPPPFTGEGDHAQHGGGCSHGRSVRHSPPPPPSGVPLPRSAGEEPGAELPAIGPTAVRAGLASGSHVLLDLRSSLAYRVRHPAGARWAIRPRLARHPALALCRARGRNAPTLVLLADEPGVAELAAVDLRELGFADLRLLDGGMEPWRAAGLPVEASPDRPDPEEAIDFLRFVHDRHDGNLDASRQYLAWEQGLIAQLDPEERAEFRLERPRGM